MMINVEQANRAYNTIYKDYIRLMDSIENHPELNLEQFSVEINKADKKGSNTYHLFVYGYQINVGLTLILDKGKYLGKITSLAKDKTRIISECYIVTDSVLISDKDIKYPVAYIGECGEQDTARKFLVYIAQKLLEKNKQ